MEAAAQRGWTSEGKLNGIHDVIGFFKRVTGEKHEDIESWWREEDNFCKPSGLPAI
jgi:hypothetical protein